MFSGRGSCLPVLKAKKNLITQHPKYMKKDLENGMYYSCTPLSISTEARMLKEVTHTSVNYRASALEKLNWLLSTC